ncbi:MAG TPA: GxxExxY protein [Candidatus Sulfotelmatobacter sp.]|nr:GxxExxY protein [Candidatus Sulfotelmatobacter sp.]
MNSQQMTQKVEDIAKDVFGTLGSGHSEVAYQKAMEIGLRLQGLRFEAQKVLELTYRQHYIGEEFLDLVVGEGTERVIVELKAVASIGEAEKQQLRNYMKTLGIGHGLLINFPQCGKNRPPKMEVESRPILPFEGENILPEKPKQKTARAGR